VSWGSAPPFSLGVEEELFLVDPKTLDAVPVADSVVYPQTHRIKHELFACIVETTTPVCRDADEVLEHLASLRREVVRRGGAIVAAGTHPLACGEGQPTVQLARYKRVRWELGDRLWTQLVCGLHVHVALPDADTALRAFEGVVPWLPVLLALSANSPYVEGEATGLRSTRAERLLQMPTGGTPPPLPDWAAWEEATAGDDTRRHWDAWPRPEHGTLEIRVMDQPTDVRRSAAFAALIQALVAAVVDDEPEPYDRELYARRRTEAARLPPIPSEVVALAAIVGPSPVFESALEADVQLELGPARALEHLALASRP
jgi:carboxylate-amine ligase